MSTGSQYRPEGRRTQVSHLPQNATHMTWMSPGPPSDTFDFVLCMNVPKAGRLSKHTINAIPLARCPTYSTFSSDDNGQQRHDTSGNDNRKRREGDRALKMNMCLAAFVDPEHRIRIQKLADNVSRDSKAQDEQPAALPATREKCRNAARRSPFGHQENASLKSGSSQVGPAVEGASKVSENLPQDDSEVIVNPRLKTIT
ncbi:hypothetical protein LTR66_006916 [Elasticomyces elasticus]|nr:hypothetical protein LTR66_006916 [Elasticomyces elasticus]